MLLNSILEFSRVSLVQLTGTKIVNAKNVMGKNILSLKETKRGRTAHYNALYSHKY